MKCEIILSTHQLLLYMKCCLILECHTDALFSDWTQIFRFLPQFTQSDKHFALPPPFR